MKSIFPKADETLLLDILANSENNVQNASEKLINMGYEKKDFISMVSKPKVEEKEEVVETVVENEQLKPKQLTEEDKIESEYSLQYS